MQIVTAGAGQPVVLVHGALCDSRFWQPVLDDIARTHRAIAVSLTGYQPALASDFTTFSAERHVAELCAFLGTLDAPAHLVGHSRGGRVALHVASRVPQAIRSLVLVEPGGEMAPDFLLPPPATAPKPVTSLNVRDQAEALVRAGEPEQAMRFYIDGGHGAGVWDGLPEILRRIVLDNATTLYGMTRDRSAPLNATVARAVTAPTLLMCGSDSPANFGRILDALESYMAQTRRLTIDGGDHFFPFTQPGAFNGVLGGWLRQF
jgi:pimeloyl-ACP methyl ester carboxylesterase